MFNFKICSTKRLLVWVRFIGLLALIVILYQMDIAKIVTLILSSDYKYLILTMILYFPLIYIKTIRWKLFLISLNIYYPLKSALCANMSCFFWGHITPARLGEFSRIIYLLREKNVKFGAALTSVLMDRFLDFYAAFFCGSLALFSFSGIEKANAFVLITAFVLPIIPVSIILNQNIYNLVKEKFNIYPTLHKKFLGANGLITVFRNAMLSISVVKMLGATVLTMLSYLLLMVEYFLISIAIGENIHFLHIVYATSLGTLVGLIPISVSGLGSQQLVISGYLIFHGFLPETAMTFALVGYCFCVLFPSLMGLFVFFIKPIPLRQDDCLKKENIYD